MTNYLEWADLKSLVIGILGGFIVLGIARYWSTRSIKSLRRRIEQSEAYKANVNNLAKSDRALLIYGLEGLFGILALIILLFVVQMILPVTRSSSLNDGDIVLALLWLLPGLACIGAIMILHDVSQYPQSIEKIDNRITKLKNKMLGRE